MFQQKLILLALLFFAGNRVVSGYDTGDLVSASIQTLHDGWKTAVEELPLSQMPYFGKQGSSVIKTQLPNPANIGISGIINPSNDVKIQLSFGNSLLVPWLTVYDSKNQRNLQSLTVVFFTDRYNVIKVALDEVYVPNNAKLDPNHPSVTAFEMKYVWRGIEDQDTPHGLFVMFLAAIFIGIFVTCVVNQATNNDGIDDATPKWRDSAESKRR